MSGDDRRRRRPVPAPPPLRAVPGGRAGPPRRSGVADRFRAAEADRPSTLDRLAGAAAGDVMADLLETTCLLELATLAASAPGLAELAQHAVDALTTFLPVPGCELSIRADGLPPVTLGSGAPVGPADGDPARFVPTAAAVRRLPVPLGDLGEGELTVLLPASGTVRPAFVDRVATTLGDGLVSVIHAERLRRQVAEADAERFAATLSDPAGVADASVGLARALAALQGVRGAVLDVDHPLLGSPLCLDASDPTGADGPVTEHARPVGEGRIEARLTWVERPGRERIDAVDGLVGRAAAALERAVGVIRLQAEADTDPLTGIANRRRGERALDDALERLDRFQEPVAVVLVDLDRFKEVNDEFGHPAGDALLRAVAEGLVGSIRAHDTAARIGGDEFLVVLPGCAALAAWRLADRLHVSLTERLDAAGIVDTAVTVSIGVSSAESTPVSREQLVASADRALYQAKQGGRDRVGHRVVDRDPAPTGR